MVKNAGVYSTRSCPSSYEKEEELLQNVSAIKAAKQQLEKEVIQFQIEAIVEAADEFVSLVWNTIYVQVCCASKAIANLFCTLQIHKCPKNPEIHKSLVHKL